MGMTSARPSYYMWDWQCGKCSAVGSAPVDIGTSALNACGQVAAHHAEISSTCDLAYQSRWIEVIGITGYSHRSTRPFHEARKA